jgi:hypothetical protein
MICLTLLEAIHVYLSSKAALTALVGSRIYRGKRPQGTTTNPAITYRKVSGHDELYQEGVSTLGEARIEVECWGSTPASAEAVRGKIRDVCQRYAGTITSGEESVVIVLMTLETDDEFYDEPQDGSDAGVFSATVDLHIWWRPTAPTG